MRSPRRPTPALLAAVLAVVLLACTPGAETPAEIGGEASPAAEPEVGADPPAIPTPTEPPSAAPAPPGGEGVGPRPDRGAVVLVHLEGPTTDVEATDLVVRTEQGEEVDRFRLAGAIEVHAAPGGRYALIRTIDGRWARYDAVRSGLSLLAFDGPGPVGPPRIAGPTAWWGDPAGAWVVRLDTGLTTPLADLLADTRPATPQPIAQATTIQATADGAHLLVRATRDHVITTADGDVRDLPGQTTVTLAADGSGLASTAPGASGSDVYVEDLDGGDRRLVGTVSGEGYPVLLPDGRVVVLGPDSALIGTDGSQADLPPTVGVTDCDVARDGLRVLCATAAQLVLVDAAAVSTTPIPGSTGMALAADQPPADVLWAVTADPAAPGAVAVDAAAGGSVTALLTDVPTTALIGLGADARTALLRVGSIGGDVAVVGVDGRTEVTATAPGGALHPDGASLALGLLDGTSRILRVTGPEASVDVPTGRAPAWLRTTPADAEPSADG